MPHHTTPHHTTPHHTTPHHTTINFLCEWSKDRKTSWSGTNYALFTSLGEFADVKDFPLLQGFGFWTALKFRRLLDKITRSNDFMMFSSKLCDYQISRLKLDKNAPCFMFTDYLTEYTPNSYLFQDLTVDYVYMMRESSSSVSRYTPLPPNVPTRKAEARLKRAEQVNKTCAGRFTMSKYLADFLVKNSLMPASRVHHVGGGCNIDPSRINTQHRNGRRFLFVGKDWERKNGPLVVEAFRKLRAKYSDAELYIAGPKILPSEAEGVSGINFLGLLNYDELVDYFNLCDFFVMPSRFEAYGLVFPEALCFGLPCIGKDICAMPEFIQDGVNGRLIHDDDPDELADCMESLLVDGKDYSSRVQSTHYEYLTRYSWRSVAQRIINVMREDGF